MGVTVETTTGQNDMAAATSVVRAYCDAWLAGNALAVLSLYHDDLTLTWPGRHRFAGIHDGQKAALEALLGLQAITNRVPVEVIDVMTGESSVMVTVLERWSTGTGNDAHSLELTRALEYTVSDNKLRTCRVYESDQSAIDEWIAAFDDTARTG